MSQLWIPLIVSYLVGAIPFAFMIPKISKNIDPRDLGDHNLGAKNVFLSVGTKEGVIVAFSDIGKGVVVVLLGKYLGLDLFGLFAMGFMAIVGHNWPIFLKLDGGQGMATTIGVLWALLPMPTSMGLCLGVMAHFATHRWMLTTAIGLVPIPILGWLWYGDPVIALYAIGLYPIIGIGALTQGWSERRRQVAIGKDHALTGE